MFEEYKIFSSLVNIYQPIDEGTGKEIGGCRNGNAMMDVWSYEPGQVKK